MCRWRNCPIEDKLVGHFLFALDKIYKFFDCVNIGYQIDHLLAPLNKATSDCLSTVYNSMIFRFSLYFAICLCLRSEHVFHVVLEIIVKVVCFVNYKFEVVH